MQRKNDSRNPGRYEAKKRQWKCGLAKVKSTEMQGGRLSECVEKWGDLGRKEWAAKDASRLEKTN